MKLFAFIAAGAVIGGLVGASQIMCPDGQCMITGSWFGGGTVGGLLGFAAAGLLPGRIDPSTLPDRTSNDEGSADRTDG